MGVSLRYVSIDSMLHTWASCWFRYANATYEHNFWHGYPYISITNPKPSPPLEGTRGYSSYTRAWVHFLHTKTRKTYTITQLHVILQLNKCNTITRIGAQYVQWRAYVQTIRHWCAICARLLVIVGEWCKYPNNHNLPIPRYHLATRQLPGIHA